MRTLLAGLAAALLLSGCTSIVVRPRNPEDPVQTYLVMEAMHKGVILPCADGSYVEYGYGDWDWFALNCNRWYHVFDTILWPTQGALGKRKVTGRTHSSIVRAYPLGRVIPIRAAREKAGKLLKDLEARHEAKTETLHRNALSGFDFVMDESSYWFLNNCNDVAADWLRRLGCRVSPAVIRGGLAVREEDVNP